MPIKKKKRRAKDSDTIEPVARVKDTRGSTSLVTTAIGSSKKAREIAKSLETEQKLITEDQLTRLESDEREHARELVRMFKYLRRLRRKLERECLQGSGNRGVYALCTVMSQQREVIADIRAITDLSSQVMVIDEQVLQPFTRTVGQTVLNAFYQLRKLVTEVSDGKQTKFGLDTVERIVTDISGSLQSQYEQAIAQTNSIFIAPPMSGKIPSKAKRTSNGR